MATLSVRRHSSLYFTNRLWRLNRRLLYGVALLETAFHERPRWLGSLLSYFVSSSELQRRERPDRPSVARSEWRETVPVVPPFKHFA